MIFCKELNKEFATKELMFQALKENKEQIVSFKKAQIQKSCEKGNSLKSKTIDVAKLNSVTKQALDSDNYYYIAVNTTKVLDSHGDLHVDGLWNVTAKQRNRKNYLVDSHVMSVKTTIARAEDVEILVEEIPFSMVGKDYPGNTQALIYRIQKDKIIDPISKNWLDGDYAIEASVRMQYVQIDFAMNSDSKEDVTFKQNFDKYIDTIANKSEIEEEFGEISYFWVVKEAKNVGESSLVLNGSNSATGQIKTTEPALVTQKTEAAKSTSHNYLLI